MKYTVPICATSSLSSARRYICNLSARAIQTARLNKAPTTHHVAAMKGIFAFAAPASYPKLDLSRSIQPTASRLPKRFSVPRRRPRFSASAALSARDSSNAATHSACGRGVQFPRRAVGLYELEREGVDPNKLIGENTRDESIFGAVIGFFVLSLVAAPLLSPSASLEGPLALLAGALLTVWAVDSLALQGLLGRAASMSMQNPERVALHEAGHMLVSFLQGFHIDGYRLPTAKAVLQASPDDPPPGVQLGRSRIACDSYSVAAVGMAGIAAEVLRFGVSEGGAQDMADVSKAVRASNGGKKVNAERLKSVVRWGLIQSVRLLKDHPAALDAVAFAMREGKSTEECIAVMEETVDRERLAAAAT